MRVTVLGSGTAVPTPDRFPAGYLVEESGRRILIDLGPGVLRRLPQVGLGLEDIDAVLLTHYHTDHCADLAALLFGLCNPRYAARRELVVCGAQGLHELLAHLTAAWPWLARHEYPRRFEVIAPGHHRVAGFDVEAIAIEHTDASLGYRIRSEAGATAAFSGDAVACDALVPLARDAELFICDSAFPGAAPGPGHMTPTEAGRAAAAANARRLVLTHCYPECAGHDLIAEARAVYGGAIVLAEDLQQFELG
ncbi:MAG: ribonuclease Z [Planctomycetes bacterium]|nr:ribonuclease Z [Planctomycetota bacterium]